MEQNFKRPRISPPAFAEREFTTVEGDACWKLHESQDWLFHPGDEAYFHLPSQQIWKRVDGEEDFAPVPHAPELEDHEDEAEICLPDLRDVEAAVDPREDDVSDGDSASTFEMDVDRTLKCYAATMKGTYPGKESNEDRHVEKEVLPLEVLSSCEACCYVSAVFDGHGGSRCVEYCKEHLLKNINASFRQIATTLERKQETFALKKDVQADPEKLKHYLGFTHSVHLEALIRAIRKGFEITDRNYQELARRNALCDGSTVLLTFFYGPDDDGLLKIVTAHAGDCRAVLCRADGVATRLTEDHKPDRQEEGDRVILNGGKVLQVRGIWRVVVDSTPIPMGLAVTRAIGDVQMKPCVSSDPEIEVHPLKLEDECFVLLASDGLWDVYSDEEACRFVQSRLLKDRGSGTEALEAMLNVAQQKGSLDDKTAVLVVLDLDSIWGTPAQPLSAGEEPVTPAAEETPSPPGEKATEPEGVGGEPPTPDVDIFAA